jgi:hypothetical protein
LQREDVNPLELKPVLAGAHSHRLLFAACGDDTQVLFSFWALLSGRRDKKDSMMVVPPILDESRGQGDTIAKGTLSASTKCTEKISWKTFPEKGLDALIA